ncbi:hypothetical protein QP157_20320 [Sphingomonas sp. LR61]|uniref:hypothetical protein n=1 Tax=Sphingomonas sp. LR61 TaxID=3050234 RepID=UPI002FE193E3
MPAAVSYVGRFCCFASSLTSDALRAGSTPPSRVRNCCAVSLDIQRANVSAAAGCCVCGLM